ncbi:hypothetical protein Pfo_005202 [Paulownia fortunei]|nr:hypothetical protein Pfo_005202 [Paulownia fortunei]
MVGVRVGLVAPKDIVVPPENTRLDPSHTSFSQEMWKLSLKQSSSRRVKKLWSFDAALLSKLGIGPFSYDLIVIFVYDNGPAFDPDMLDLTEDALMEKFSAGVTMLTSISLVISYPTLAAALHMPINAFKNAIALATEYPFPRVENGNA